MPYRKLSLVFLNYDHVWMVDGQILAKEKPPKATTLQSSETSPEPLYPPAPITKIDPYFSIRHSSTWRI